LWIFPDSQGNHATTSKRGAGISKRRVTISKRDASISKRAVTAT